MTKKGTVHRKTTLRILREAKAILSDKEKWCQKRLAVGHDDWFGEVEYEASPISDDAVKFCALGAIIHVAGEKLEEIKLKRKQINQRTGDKCTTLVHLGSRTWTAVNYLYDYLPEDDAATKYSAVKKDKKQIYAGMYLQYINDKNGHGRRSIVAAMGHAIAALVEDLA